MSYPKFAVGEDVVIYSETNPDFNGSAAVVVSSEWTIDQYDSRTNEPLPDGYGYILDPHFCPLSEFWDEPELRKRPSDLSFGELITSLKDKEPVGSM